MSRPCGWQTLKFVRLIHYLSLILGISTVEACNNFLIICNTLYVVILCVVLSSLSVYNIYFRIVTVYSALIPTTRVLDVILNSVISVAGIGSLIFGSFLRRSSSIRLTRNMRKLEDALFKKIQPSQRFYNEKIFLILFFLFQAYVLRYILADLVVNLSLSLSTFPFVSYFTHIYILAIVVLQMTSKLLFVKESLNIFNKLILEHAPFTTKTGPKVKFFLRIYLDVWKLIDLINHIYGVQITLIVLSLIFILLYNVNWLLKSLMGIQEATPGYNLIQTRTFVTISIFVSYALILVINCEKVLKQLKNTSVITYNILLNYSSEPKSSQKQETVEELILLSEHIGRRKIQFSAAGLFPVDYTMLYLIIGAVTSNIVIILQFR